MATTETISCLEEVPNNKFVQEKVLNSVFNILESCSSEQELEERLNKALAEDVDNGLIDLSNREIGSLSEKVGPAISALALCRLEENINENVSASDIVKGIVDFLCNLPKFDFSLYKINFSFDIRAIIEAIKDALLSVLVQLLIEILSELLTVAIDLCELDFEFGTNDFINSLLEGSVVNFFGSRLINGINFTIEILQDIFASFGLDFSSGAIIPATGDSCEPTNEELRPAGQFLSDVSTTLTTKELCQILKGIFSPTVLDKIKEILEFDYPTLNKILNTDEKIINLFSKIGSYINPDACFQNPQQYENLCNFKDLNEVKRNLLATRGLSQEQIDEFMEKDNKRLQDKVLNVANIIAKLKKDPNSLFDGATSVNLLCNNNKEGVFKLSDFENIVTSTKTLTNYVFEQINDSYKHDSQRVAQLNYKYSNRRKYIKKIIEDYRVTDPTTGEVTIIEKMLNPKYLIEIEGGNKSFVVESSDDQYGYDEGQEPYNINTIINMPSDAILVQYSKVMNGDNDDRQDFLASVQNPEDDIIIGIVAEFREKSVITSDELPSPTSSLAEGVSVNPLPSQNGLLYTAAEDSDAIIDSVNIQNNFTNKKTTSLTTLYLKKPDVAVDFLTENSYVKLYDIVVREFDADIIKNISLMYEKTDGESVPVKLSDLANDTILENKKTLYSNFSVSDGPFRPISDQTKEIVSTTLPDLLINASGRSSQEQVFYELTKDYVSEPYNFYKNISLEFLNQLKGISSDNIKETGYQSFVDLFFVEGLLRLRYEKNQFLDKFLNDPCSLNTESFLQEIPPLPSALITVLQRLFIKTHVIKNLVKNMPFLYKFDIYELVKNDDLFVEFTLQTLLNEIEGYTTSREDFKTLMDSSINSRFDEEYTNNNFSITDPFTEQLYDFNQSEFSLDFRYRYFIKKEVLNVLQSFRQAYYMQRGEYPITFEDYFFSDETLSRAFGSAETFSSTLPKLQGINLIPFAYDSTNEDTEVSLAYYSFVNSSAPETMANYKFGLKFVLYKETYLGDSYTPVVQKYEIIVKDSTQLTWEEAKPLLIQQLKEKAEYKIIMNFCFNTSKFISFNYMNEVLTYSRNSYDSDKILATTSKRIRDLIFELYRAKDKNKKASDCYSSAYDNLNTNFNLPDLDYLKELLLRLLLEAPIIVIKLLAEQFDPNISITNKIRVLAELGTKTGLSAAGVEGAQDIQLPILPFVAALWPINFFGWGPPTIPMLGVPYIIIDTIETAVSIANLNLKKVDSFNQFEIEFIGELNIENPFIRENCES